MTEFDAEALARTVQRRRTEQGLSLKDLSRETGLSPSTLSRVTRAEGVPGSDALARLARWLGMPPGRFVPSTAANRVEAPVSLPDFVEAQLQADASLPPARAACLARIFRDAYGLLAGEKEAA